MALGSKSRVPSAESANYTDSGYAPSGSAFNSRESPSFPFFSSFQSALRHPRILESLLHFLHYEDFSSLTSCCSELRNLMGKPALKNAVLSCFLPGFRSLLRFKSPELFVDVHVTVGDLNIFYLSSKIGSDEYPIHAVQFNTGFDDAYQRDLLCKLQYFTTVHSKFVLLLQSLAHSSFRPLKPELEEISPRSTPQTYLLPGVKQLHFPEPLCYANSPAIQKTSSYHRHKRSQSAEIVTGLSRTSGRRKSLLLRSKAQLPSPSTDFIIRQSYFSPWRRILESSSPTRSPEPTSPRRRRFHNTSSWSDSSLSTSTRLSMVQEKRGSIYVSRLRIPFQSPHDIRLATSRLRAPVLRVFVPCSELNDLSIAACEDQLADAGLWDHLSIGDIVCNLGYVPPSSDDDSDRDTIIPASSSVMSHLSSLSNGNAAEDTAWLVYDGSGLVQYTPLVEPPPLKDALTLVTPHYYSHLLPSTANPCFTLNLYSRLSRFRKTGGNTFSSPPVPKFELTVIPMKVRSPRSPGGYAMVKRYKWVAVIKAVKTALSGNLEVGSGWLTDEWALEVDGTFEGRRMLESFLSNADISRKWARGDWVWEIDRQRSNMNMTWFRLLGSSEDYVLPLDPIIPSPVSPTHGAPLSRGSAATAAGNQRRFSFMRR